jgi:tetratricopeptide (TPR) repeat protein
MTIPINPYVAGNPVGDTEAFIGRVDVLREVARVLRRPNDNAIVLFGQRRIGKTSILQHLVAQLPKEGNYRAVLFDLMDKAAWPLGRVLGELARTIANKLDLPVPDLGADPETAFRKTWLVLLFDEFDVLADAQGEQAAAAFFPYLRDLMSCHPRRLKFVFVIGRNVNDLTNIALSLFKGTPSQRVSLLAEQDTADLVRLSQKNHSLDWPDEAVGRVWQLTHGHPFLTQQLCSHVWERVYDEEPDVPPIVTSADVDAVIPGALEASRNTLEWLWNGLPPAGRVVVSALAEGGPSPITQDDLERLLRDSGVRVLIRELQNAPQLLQEWDLIEPADGGYCFRVELLRQWLAANKPLRRVQEELDRVEPVAEDLYQAASKLYRGGQLDQAAGLLRQAVALNPNHVRANQLLADILLAHDKPDDAMQLLERLYEYQPSAARPRLVQTLLRQVQTASDDDKRLDFYAAILKLDSAQPEALSGKQRIWQQRGDTAFKNGDLDTALTAYQEAGLADKVIEVEQEKHLRELDVGLQNLKELELTRKYQDALSLAHKLANEYPTVRDWGQDRERLERKIRLAETYQRALGALASGDRLTAQGLLAQVIALEPSYEEATRYLHLAVTGEDVKQLRSQLDARKKSRSRVKTAAEKKQQPETNKLLPPDLHEQPLLGQTKAIEQETSEAPPRESPEPRKLVPWNPLDQLTWLWWVLAMPNMLQAYRARWENHDLQVGRWLVGTMIWLPFFIPALALDLGVLPRATTTVIPPSIYPWLHIGLVLAWILTCYAANTPDVMAAVVGIMATCIVCLSVIGVWAGSMAFVVEAVVEFATAFVVVGIVIFLVYILLEEASGNTGDLSGAGVVIIIVIAAVGIVLTFWVGMRVINPVSVWSILVGLVVGVTGGVSAGIATHNMEQAVKVVRLSWLVRGAFVILVIVYAFLIWFSFLGGWRMF